MAEGTKLEIVSPERLLLSETVKSVTVPGADGYFTVLGDHAPLMTTLKPGFVTVVRNDGISHVYYVRGGFADVTPTGLTVLAEQAVPVDDIDDQMLAREVKNAEEDVADATDPERKASAELRLNQLKEVQAILHK